MYFFLTLISDNKMNISGIASRHERSSKGSQESKDIRDTEIGQETKGSTVRIVVDTLFSHFNNDIYSKNGGSSNEINDHEVQLEVLKVVRSYLSVLV